MAKDAKGGKASNDGGNRGILCIVVAVLQMISLFFMAIGSPYDQLKLSDTSFMGGSGDLCYSVWGTKRCGGSHPLAWHDKKFYNTCGVFEACLKAAAAFSIISLAAFAAGFGVSLMIACKCLVSKIPLVLFCIFGIVASSVPWMVIAGLYNNSTCGIRFKSVSKYAPGFSFFVVSWCLSVISFIITIFA